MTKYARRCVQLALDYFKNQMDIKVNEALNVFKAARLFSPQKADSMQPSALDIECLSAFPFFDDDFIMKLKSELPTFIYLSVLTQMEISVHCNGGNEMHWNFHIGLKLLKKSSSSTIFGCL